MDSKITINIVEPGSGPTPSPVVPNTGLFTSGIGGPEITTISISAVLILTMVAIIITALLYRKQKKSGKVTKLVHLVDSTKAVLKSKKRITAGLSAIALLASAGTLTTLLANAGKSNTNAADGNDSLTLNVSSEDFTIEVGDSPVFAVLPVELTVEEATVAGYTLTAYANSTDLVSTTDSSKVIPMVAASEGELAALADNTYGLSLVKPESKDEEAYTTLSTDQSNPTILKATDYTETAANDTTTIYYGFYITPDVPYGTYTGTNINYNVEPHYITNLSFDGNGNDGGEEIESRIIPAGDTITLPENTFTKEGYNFIGWNTVAEPTEQDPGESYADQAEYTAVQGETKDVTLYAQWKQVFYMQDVATWGSKLTQGNTMEAVDKRDGKTYYVSRLADNKIWMTQNLDLDLSTEKTLTPADTNITADWTPANSTIALTGPSVYDWQNNDYVPYSADPGDVYYYTSNTNNNDIKYNSLTECKAAGHTDCAHYHAGNYYNWSVAVAMNNTSEYGDDDRYVNVETSICPAGWRLPKNRNADGWTEGNEQDAMTSSYDGIVGEVKTGGGGIYAYRDYLDGGFNKIRTAPLWLARSGYVLDGSLGNTGNYGFYWSSTVYSSSNAYRLIFNSGNVSSASNSGRNSGYSVRCVAQ